MFIERWNPVKGCALAVCAALVIISGGASAHEEQEMFKAAVQEGEGLFAQAQVEGLASHEKLRLLLKAKKKLEAALDLAKYLKYSGVETDSRKAKALLAAVRRALRLEEMGEPAATFTKAETARKSRKYDHAVTLYEKIRKEHTSHSLSDQSGYCIGLARFEQGKLGEAEKQWRAFVEEKPLGPWRGTALLSLGDLQLERHFDAGAAEKEYARILKEQGSDETWKEILPDAHTRLGICLYMRKRFDEAARHFEADLRLRPERKVEALPVVLPNRVKCLIRMCREKKYPVYYSGAVMRGDLRVQTVLFLASAYLEIGSCSKAENLLDRVLKGEFSAALPVHRAYALMEKAECLRMSARLDEAVKLLSRFETDRALSTSPIAPMALLEKASTLVTKSQFEEGLRIYDLIASKYARDAHACTALYRAGFVGYVRKDWPRAVEHYRRLVARYPSSWEAKKVKEWLLPKCEENLKNSEKK